MGTDPEREIPHRPCADALDGRRDLRINASVAAGTDEAPEVNEARQEHWLAENAVAFAAQADWHARNGHPLAEIMVGPGGASWTR